MTGYGKRPQRAHVLAQFDSVAPTGVELLAEPE
jgi:hypothetical protein